MGGGSWAGGLPPGGGVAVDVCGFGGGGRGGGGVGGGGGLLLVWGVWGVGAGTRPGGRLPFLCFAKEKEAKERRPCCGRPFAALRATCGARFSWGPRKLAALKHARP